MAEINGNNTSITLQINTAGAWKNVFSFEPSQRAAILGGLSALAGILGDSAKWALLRADGEREWLDDVGTSSPVWHAITDATPTLLEDVMVSVRAPSDDHAWVYMAYRKADGEFYVSGTDDGPLRHVYAWTPVMDAAPAPTAQQVAA